MMFPITFTLLIAGIVIGTEVSRPPNLGPITLTEYDRTVLDQDHCLEYLRETYPGAKYFAQGPGDYDDWAAEELCKD